MNKNFAITGVAGFVAPRHLRAIRDTGNRLVAATDPMDSVGLLDQYSLETRFFPEIERFDRHLEKLRRGPEEQRIHYVSICSPNYLHDAHIRLALRAGAHAICEKPLVISPWNLDALQLIEQETGRRVFNVLQLRLHPSMIALREQLDTNPAGRKFDVSLTYVTARGRWYDVSWKGDEGRSGGLATNIGIHFFDALLWMFGGVQRVEVHVNSARRMAGVLELERARVRWFLSVESSDLPDAGDSDVQRTYRSMTVDGQEVEFSGGFTDLHTELYRRTLAGDGFGIEEARPSIELVHRIHTTRLSPAGDRSHALVRS